MASATACVEKRLEAESKPAKERCGPRPWPVKAMQPETRASEESLRLVPLRTLHG